MVVLQVFGKDQMLLAVIPDCFTFSIPVIVFCSLFAVTLITSQAYDQDGHMYPGGLQKATCRIHPGSLCDTIALCVV